LPDEVTGKELDRAVHAQLRTLTKENSCMQRPLPGGPVEWRLRGRRSAW
jgi:hypothetical protein